jgi:hypothetical protein
MGDKLGRIHMEHQNLDKMKTRRATALRGERHTKRTLDDGSGSNDTNNDDDAGSTRKIKKSRSG